MLPSLKFAGSVV